MIQAYLKDLHCKKPQNTKHTATYDTGEDQIPACERMKNDLMNLSLISPLCLLGLLISMFMFVSENQRRSAFASCSLFIKTTALKPNHPKRSSFRPRCLLLFEGSLQSPVFLHSALVCAAAASARQTSLLTFKYNLQIRTAELP